MGISRQLAIDYLDTGSPFLDLLKFKAALVSGDSNTTSGSSAIPSSVLKKNKQVDHESLEDVLNDLSPEEASEILSLLYEILEVYFSEDLGVGDIFSEVDEVENDQHSNHLENKIMLKESEERVVDSYLAALEAGDETVADTVSAMAMEIVLDAIVRSAKNNKKEREYDEKQTDIINKEIEKSDLRRDVLIRADLLQMLLKDSLVNHVIKQLKLLIGKEDSDVKEHVQEIKKESISIINVFFNLASVEISASRKHDRSTGERVE